MTSPTAAFVSQLRSRPGVVRLGSPEEPVLSLRVQVPEVWDVVRFAAPPTTPVRELKRLALALLKPDVEHLDEWVIKLGGFEVLDEGMSVEQAGALDGSVFLLTGRRRQPVK